ncbi:DciA family protein [Methylophilaceae bacterium]|nr:DciA family protein [Methylophilaceae bacterium]
MEPIKKLLDGQKFSEFNAKKKEYDSLQKILLDCLDKKFKGKVLAKNMLNNVFIIEAMNSAVASQLKLASASLIEEINNSKKIETKIKKIKINLAIHHPKNPKRNIKNIPASANQSLRDMKAEMSNSPLRSIINGLFKTKK